MTRFANVLPPEEAEWVRVPEFRRHKEVFSQEEYENNEFRDPPLILDDLNNRITDLGSSPSTESSSNSEDAE